MSRFAKLLTLIIVLSVALATLLFLGERLARSVNPAEQIEISSRTILDRITDQYFVVTKTVVVDQTSNITIDQGSAWSNFLWGQTIEAHGTVRVDIGVDLSELSEEDIEINERTKTVTIALPDASVLDANQIGDIEVDTKSGVLKFLFENDPTEDHNLALKQLAEDARASVQSQELLEEARQDATKLLTLIVQDLGYTVEVK